MDYITCEKRKNAPQINVLICEKKCKHLKTCSSYRSYCKMKTITASLNESATGADGLLLPQDAARPNLPSAAGK
jgi:hypothetical protein